MTYFGVFFMLINKNEMHPFGICSKFFLKSRRCFKSPLRPNNTFFSGKLSSLQGVKGEFSRKKCVYRQLLKSTLNVEEPFFIIVNFCTFEKC